MEKGNNRTIHQYSLYQRNLYEVNFNEKQANQTLKYNCIFDLLEKTNFDFGNVKWICERALIKNRGGLNGPKHIALGISERSFFFLQEEWNE